MKASEEVKADPKSFFVELILEQGRRESVLFSPDELQYLELVRLSKDKEAQEVLKRNIPARKFEEMADKFSGLILRAYQRDAVNYSDANERYEEAFSALANVDSWPHLSMYTCVLVNGPEAPIGSRVTKATIVGWLITVAVIALGYYIGTHWRR